MASSMYCSEVQALVLSDETRCLIASHPGSPIFLDRPVKFFDPLSRSVSSNNNIHVTGVEKDWYSVCFQDWVEPLRCLLLCRIKSIKERIIAGLPRLHIVWNLKSFANILSVKILAHEVTNYGLQLLLCLSLSL